MKIALPETITSLAAVLGCGTTPPKPVRLDRALARFAIERHRVGPLVHTGVSRGRVQADTDAADALARSWTLNVQRCAMNALTTARCAEALSLAEIGFVAFKGMGLAQQLYPSPQWRHCGDVDLLVPVGRLAQAADALRQAGLDASDPIFHLPQFVGRFALRKIRDVRVDDRRTGLKIELHARPFFSAAISDRLLAAEPSFRPRLSGHADVLPIPEIGPGLALYLLLHGAVSGWTRLKWMADIPLLLQKLDDVSLDRIAALAEATGTVLAVKASLQLVRTTFDGIQLGPLTAWIDERSGAAGVKRRLAAYAAWLGDASSVAANPLRTRTEGLKTSLLLDDSLLRQFATLPRGTLAAGLRILASGAAPRPDRTAAPIASPESRTDGPDRPSEGTPRGV